MSSETCPPVVYDCPTGPADIVAHDENGLLVPLNDETVLRDELARLLGRSETRTRLAQSAQNVAEEYSEDRFLRRWQQLLG